MCDLVELIMNDLTKINEHVLLELNLGAFVDFNATSVNNTHITDKVTPVLADNHELTLPKFLVVRNLVVVGLSLTDLEASSVSFKGEAEVLKLLGVD